MADEHSEETGGELLKNLVAMQQKFDKVLSPSDFVSSLPKQVQRRIRALKNLQKETFHIQMKFFEELHRLEAKYEKLYSPMFEKRYLIVSAALEPAECECIWSSDEEDEDDEIPPELLAKDGCDTTMDTNGVPNFWVQVFKNVDILNDLIQECDEPILKHLVDVRVKSHTSFPPGFTLEFVFEPNEYFQNSILTKEYTLKFDVDSDNPLEYDGPEITKCKGCTIDWKPGMNVTKKKIKKTQQHRSHGAKRTIVKTVPNDSFFNFFSPPEAMGNETDEDTEEALSSDFEIGHFLRDQVIPKALLFYTGDALEYNSGEELNTSGEPSSAEEQ